MTTSRILRLAGAVGLAALLACGALACSSRPVDTAAFGAAGELPGCRLVVHKCSRCHESERIFAYAPASPRSLRSLVERMRHKGGSSINASDGRAITECLVVRRFGQDGLDSLTRGDADVP